MTAIVARAGGLDHERRRLSQGRRQRRRHRTLWRSLHTARLSVIRSHPGARGARGARSLGVRPQSLTFLGFPDDGLCQLASAQPSTNAPVFRSPYTSRISPPPSEQIIRGVQYRGLDLRRELEHVMVAFHPTLILVPHPADEHPDHCSTHIFLDDAIERLAGQGWTRPHVLHYLIHYRGWPLAGDVARGDVSPPAEFSMREGRWLSLPLTPAEVASKREAVLAHHSQMLVIGSFMLAFARTHELFVEGEPPVPKCWCNGENIATGGTPSQDRHSRSMP